MTPPLSAVVDPGNHRASLPLINGMLSRNLHWQPLRRWLIAGHPEVAVADLQRVKT